MNKKRRATVWRTGGSVVVAVPPDWLEGEEVEPGDEVEILYDGVIVIATKEAVGRAREAFRRLEQEKT
jgi:antitoxin component of MazEF toxin-antitoxin module